MIMGILLIEVFSLVLIFLCAVVLGVILARLAQTTNRKQKKYGFHSKTVKSTVYKVGERLIEEETSKSLLEDDIDYYANKKFN